MTLRPSHKHPEAAPNHANQGHSPGSAVAPRFNQEMLEASRLIHAVGNLRKDVSAVELSLGGKNIHRIEGKLSARLESSAQSGVLIPDGEPDFKVEVRPPFQQVPIPSEDPLHPEGTPVESPDAPAILFNATHVLPENDPVYLDPARLSLRSIAVQQRWANRRSSKVELDAQTGELVSNDNSPTRGRSPKNTSVKNAESVVGMTRFWHSLLFDKIGYGTTRQNARPGKPSIVEKALARSDMREFELKHSAVWLKAVPPNHHRGTMAPMQVVTETHVQKRITLSAIRVNGEYVGATLRIGVPGHGATIYYLNSDSGVENAVQELTDKNGRVSWRKISNKDLADRRKHNPFADLTKALRTA